MDPLPNTTSSGNIGDFLDFDEIFNNFDNGYEQEEKQKKTVTNFKKTVDVVVTDELSSRMLNVHTMLKEMNDKDPEAFIGMISNPRVKFGKQDFNMDPTKDPLNRAYDFDDFKTNFQTEIGEILIVGDTVSDYQNRFIVFQSIDIMEQTFLDIYEKRELSFIFWEKVGIREPFQEIIPFIHFITTKEDDGFVFLQVISDVEWQRKKLEFRRNLRTVKNVMQYDDSFIGHYVTSDPKFRAVARDAGLRFSFDGELYHFSFDHPWLFDMYCSYAFNSSTKNYMSPVKYVTSFMDLAGKIIMPIDMWLYKEKNIDGSDLCEGFMSMEHQTNYVKCNRLQCTCYNPFVWNDKFTMLTSGFKKHLSITTFRDVGTDLIITGTMFSRSSNPNCPKCTGARFACACKGDLRKAAQIRDYEVSSIHLIVYVMGAVTNFTRKLERITLVFLPDFSFYSAIANYQKKFLVSDGTDIFSYSKNTTMDSIIQKHYNELDIFSVPLALFHQLDTADSDLILSLFNIYNTVLNGKIMDRQTTNHQVVDELVHDLAIKDAAIIEAKRKFHGSLRKKKTTTKHPSPLKRTAILDSTYSKRRLPPSPDYARSPTYDANSPKYNASPHHPPRSPDYAPSVPMDSAD